MSKGIFFLGKQVFFLLQLLKHATSIMLEARQRQHGMSGNPDTSQLLLIVSDGRGLFLEGMEVVKTAVRQAREANVFLVFVVLDNPLNKVRLQYVIWTWGNKTIFRAKLN